MHGELTVQEISPAVVLITLKGHLAASLADEIKAKLEPILARGKRPHLFFDAEEASGLDTKFRTELTPWHKAINSRVSSQNILVKSKILQMAISVANLAMGDLLKAYNKRQEFAAAMKSAQG